MVISRTAVWTAVCFARRNPASSERRSRMSLGGIQTVEADLVQGPPRTGLRGTFEQRFELGGRQGNQPAIWLLVHDSVRR